MIWHRSQTNGSVYKNVGSVVHEWRRIFQLISKSCCFCLHCVVAMGHYSHGKFGSLSPTKASCNRVALYPNLINYKMHAGSFRVSVIHRTLTCTTGSQFNVIILKGAYAHGSWDTPTTSQHNIVTRKKSLANTSCAPDGVRTSAS